MKQLFYPFLPLFCPLGFAQSKSLFFCLSTSRLSLCDKKWHAMRNTVKNDIRLVDIVMESYIIVNNYWPRTKCSLEMTKLNWFILYDYHPLILYLVVKIHKFLIIAACISLMSKRNILRGMVKPTTARLTQVGLKKNPSTRFPLWQFRRPKPERKRSINLTSFLSIYITDWVKEWKKGQKSSGLGCSPRPRIGTHHISPVHIFCFFLLLFLLRVT